ncbi:MAG: hypothetical protein ABFS10_08825 [Bacteroidota bacterium]
MKTINSSIAFILIMLPLVHLQAQREYLPTADDLTRFKATKTYVVMNGNPLSDYNFEIRDAIEKQWTITDYEFLDHDDFGEKSLDKNASFLYMAVVDFEKEKSQNRYMFLCLSLGGPRETLDDLNDITNLPLGYHGVDEDHYTYKLGTLVRFMQNHVNLLIEDPALVSQSVFQYYNKNMGDLSDKTLYLVEDEIEYEIATEEKIREIYPYDFQIVERERIKELIMAGDENAVFLHKVGPEERNMNVRTYKILIGAADARFYYYNYHKVSDKKPDAIIKNDFRRLSKAN